jgi:hypothetical protein
MAWAQIHRARISNRHNFITKAVIAMRKKATDVLTTVFKSGRIWASAVKAIESYEIRQRGRRGGEILMGSGSRLGKVPYRRSDWPNAFLSQWALIFVGSTVSKLYRRDCNTDSENEAVHGQNKIETLINVFTPRPRAQSESYHAGRIIRDKIGNEINSAVGKNVTFNFIFETDIFLRQCVIQLFFETRDRCRVHGAC